MSHETYADIRSRVYIGKPEYFARINRFLEDDTSPPLVILICESFLRSYFNS